MTLWLRIVAPFAAYRGLQAGVYRTSMPVMPYSAAYGLVLNLAGIETRSAAEAVTTGTRDGLPALELALGVVSVPEVSTIYQQLHSYPVGNSGAELEEKSHGQKYWIAPARREFLVGLDMVVGVRGDQGLLARVAPGLAGALDEPRYGIPFAGDNNLLFDRIDVVDAPALARWYEAMSPGAAPRAGSCRLTVEIDRGDSSRSRSVLVAPGDPSSSPSAACWVRVAPKGDAKGSA